MTASWLLLSRSNRNAQNRGGFVVRLVGRLADRIHGGGEGRGGAEEVFHVGLAGDGQIGAGAGGRYVLTSAPLACSAAWRACLSPSTC